MDKVETYSDRYYAFREEAWMAFEQLVRKGAKFPKLIDVFFPLGPQPAGLSYDKEGRAWFYASEILANKTYQLFEGEHIYIKSGEVSFVSDKGQTIVLRPVVEDVEWIVQVLDGETKVDQE
jgi:hypothetical protein